jgi:hypothetical protein
MFTTVYILQAKMKELLPNDSATMSSIVEGIIYWAPDDAYAKKLVRSQNMLGEINRLEVGIKQLKAPLNITCLQHAHKHLYNWWWMNRNN